MNGLDCDPKSVVLGGIKENVQNNPKCRLKLPNGDSLEKSLCELLIVQILCGKKPKSFVKEAWIEVKDEFNKKNGQSFTMDQIKNRYNVLRVRHNDMKKLMSLSGFEWDSEDKKIIVDDEGVWDAYLGENPDKKKYKTNGCPIYEELCTIFGGSTATGSNAYVLINALALSFEFWLYMRHEN
ncbi:uncharacterized protein LOC113291636 [Papaver somniferum]|uniref:uncharacterized protein LOC113291636 n=1 Tax=Papaver somniferum TaxID=3469 RepID=UPI000E703BC6|nr:uncharacterized protein LOC113291636 [Papaver somniferum]